MKAADFFHMCQYAVNIKMGALRIDEYDFVYGDYEGTFLVRRLHPTLDALATLNVGKDIVSAQRLPIYNLTRLQLHAPTPMYQWVKRPTPAVLTLLRLVS